MRRLLAAVLLVGCGNGADDRLSDGRPCPPGAALVTVPRDLGGWWEVCRQPSGLNDGPVTLYGAEGVPLAAGCRCIVIRDGALRSRPCGPAFTRGDAADEWSCSYAPALPGPPVPIPGPWDAFAGPRLADDEIATLLRECPCPAPLR